MIQGMAVCQKPLCLKRLESDTSGFMSSLDHLELQDNTEELDVDQCDAKLRGQCPYLYWSLTQLLTASHKLVILIIF